MAWSPPSKVGDIAPVVAAAKQKIQKFQYGRDNVPSTDTSEVYTEGLLTAMLEFQRRVHNEVLAGQRETPDVPTDGTIDWATQVQLGIIERQKPTIPTVGPRHPAIVFRGTGGIIGQDLVSLVCQHCADLVEEINPDWPATMGGIPVGTAGNISDPSMWRGVQIAVADAQRRFLDILAKRPAVKIVIGGYSAGAVAAAIFKQWIMDNFPDHYLCSFSFGDPTRPVGGAFFAAPVIPWGRGVASVHYGDPKDWRHCWLTAEGDMYGQVPQGVTGDIMDDAFDMVTRVELSNILETAQAIIPRIPEVAEKAGIGLPSVLGALAGGIPGLLGLGLPWALGAISGLVGTGNPDLLTGSAAAAKAAQIALTFAAQGTAPHIEYHMREVWPGQTYLGLAIQHVRDYASATPATA
ncbi:lysin B [Mycobacterium phage Typha]|uniref:Lysin B n=1 Tax=Mycobacterium phage Typha TaxID=2517971 RepID=A0A482JBU5_9CAUD|nr:lysin B [Mycobacterium phage Typha]QBP29689.1 lysin B [Mycobacterium phage Typha]